jgi:hypothetical protein
MPRLRVSRRYRPMRIIDFLWESMGLLEKWAVWCTAIKISGWLVFCKYDNMSTAVRYFHVYFRPLPSRSWWSKPLATGVDVELVSVLNSLLHRLRKFSSQSIRNGWDNSNELSSRQVILTPKNLFTPPLSVNLKFSGPDYIEEIRRSMESLEGLIMMRSLA